MGMPIMKKMKAKTKMNQEQFDAIVREQQDIQKRNPFGSPEHRAAYDAIRQAVWDFHGNDIGDYE